MSVKWEQVEVLGKKCLFYDDRIYRNSVPKDWNFYEVRHDDNSWGDPVEIGLGIGVNFLGTLITKESFELKPLEGTNNAYLDIDYENDWKYLYKNAVRLGES